MTNSHRLGSLSGFGVSPMPVMLLMAISDTHSPEAPSRRHFIYRKVLSCMVYSLRRRVKL